MPALKKTRDQQADIIVRGAIGRGRAMESMQVREMGPMLGICPKTFWARMEHPGEFKLSEIRVLSRKFKFTDEEIIGMVRGGSNS